MIEATLARLTVKSLHTATFGTLKQTISKQECPGIKMTFMAPGLRLEWRGKKTIIPYSMFEYIVEGAEIFVEEKITNAKRIQGSEDLKAKKDAKKDE